MIEVGVGSDDVLQFIAEHGGTHQAPLDAGIPGVVKWLKKRHVAFQSRTVEHIIAWAGNAVIGDPLCSVMTRIWQTLLIDWQHKTEQIHAVERDLAGLLVQTPWILLLLILTWAISLTSSIPWPPR